MLAAIGLVILVVLVCRYQMTTVYSTWYDFLLFITVHELGFLC